MKGSQTLSEALQLYVSIDYCPCRDKSPFRRETWVSQTRNGFSRPSLGLVGDLHPALLIGVYLGTG